MFHINDNQDEYEVEEETGEVIVRPGDIFQLGEHRVIFGSFTDPDVQCSLMQNQRARI